MLKIGWSKLAKMAYICYGLANLLEGYLNLKRGQLGQAEKPT